MSLVATGDITSVDSRPVGSRVVGGAVAGDQTLFVNDNVDFTPGDEVLITPLDADTGELYVVDAVDDEVGLTFTTPLGEDIPDGSLVAFSPVRTETVATVRLAETGEVRECVVLHTLVDALRPGLRDEADSENVLTVMADGQRYVFDIISQKPERDLADAVIGVTPLDTTLQDIYDTADANAAAAAAAAAIGTASGVAANGKNKVTWSASGPGVTANTAGDIWWQRSGGVIAGQWVGLGGTSWQSQTLAGAVIAYLDAGQLTAGSAFVNGLQVLTNFTLGDASTNGVIQSYNFAGSSVGVYIDKFGLVAKGGSIAGATVTGGIIRTAPSGARVELGTASTGLNSVNFYYSSGGNLGRLVADLGTGFALQSGDGTGSGWGAKLSLYSDHARFSDDLEIGGDLTAINGHVNLGIVSASSATITGALHADDVFVDTPTVTSGGVGVFMGSSGKLFPNVSPSLVDYKRDLEEIDVDPDALASLVPLTYRYREDVPFAVDDPDQVFYGYMYDDAAALGIHELLDDSGEFPAAKPERLAIVAFSAWRKTHARLIAAEATIADLTAQLAEIRAHLGMEGPTS